MKLSVISCALLALAGCDVEDRFLEVFDTTRDLTIRVLGGYLTSDRGSLGAGGFLYTRLSQTGMPVQAISFFFSPLPFGHFHNRLAADSFSLWGNNTVMRDGAPVDNPALRVGINLRTMKRRQQSA